MKSGAIGVIAERAIGAHVIDQERDRVQVALFGGAHEGRASERVARVGQLGARVVACGENGAQTVDVVGVGGRVDGRALRDRVVGVARGVRAHQQRLGARELALKARQVESRASVGVAQLDQARVDACEHVQAVFIAMIRLITNTQK